MSTVWVPQIHCLLDFEKSPDPERLSRALRLLLDAEPVLGCRYRPRFFRPYWERLPAAGLDREPLLVLAEGEGAGAAEAAFLAAPLEVVQGAQVRALLVRKAAGWRLAVKVNHQVADAAGTRQVAYRLAGIYRKLAADATYRPNPNLASRSLTQVYRSVGLGSLPAIYRRFLVETLRNAVPPATHQHPCGFTVDDGPHFVTEHLDREFVSDLKRRLRPLSATINDALCTALLRAMANRYGWDGSRRHRLIGTVDLRRYLANAADLPVCNLSGFSYINLGPRLGDRFEETLERVKAAMDENKANHLGLAGLLGSWLHLLVAPFGAKIVLSRRLIAHAAKSGNMAPGFTNLGLIRESELDFDGMTPTHARLLAPAGVPPHTVMAVSGYRGSLTLNAGVFAAGVAPETIRALFAQVRQELA